MSALYRSLLFMLSFLLFSGYLTASNEKPDLEPMIGEKMEEARPALQRMADQLSVIEKMTAGDQLELTEEELSELEKLRCALEESSIQAYKNVYLILKIRDLAVWIHVYYPPKIVVLNPIAPLNEGIQLSRLVTGTSELPIVIVFGDYREQVNLIPGINAPVLIAGVGASISGLGVPAFQSFIGPGDNNIYGKGYSFVGGFNIHDNHTDSGGAIRTFHSRVVFSLNYIHDNSASSYGGGICSFPGVNPDTTDKRPFFIANFLTNNTADRGGAMAFVGDEKSVSLLNLIAGNAAEEMGGGVYFDQASNYFAANSVVNNSTDGSGGGIAFHEAKLAVAAANLIQGNTSPNNGGGVLVTNGGSSIPILALNMINDNSAAQDGGGICLEDEGEAILILNNPIRGNQAVRGGGISMRETTFKTYLFGNKLDANTATIGGGIWAEDFDALIFSGEIHGNQATDSGGGIYLAGGNPSINRVRIAGNQSPLGGGIFGAYNGEPVFDGVNFENNRADQGGGVYLVEGEDPVFEECGFSQNQANDKGGGIFFTRVTSPRIAPNCNFYGNSALFGGGIYYEEQTNPNINNSLFQKNKARKGGAIYCNDIQANIHHNEFRQNESSGSGAAIFVVTGMSPTLTQNVFVGNIAGSPNAPTVMLATLANIQEDTAICGGGIYTAGAGADPVITHNYFQWNEAPFGGGLAVLDDSKPILANNDFVENLGGLSESEEAGIGGGLLVANTEVTVRWSDFVGNYAGYGAGAACFGEAEVLFLNSNFYWNAADIDSTGQGYGGGVLSYGEGTTVTIGERDSSCVFRENFAARGGAVAGAEGSTTLLFADSLIANRAAYNTTGAGGALYFTGATTTATIGGNAVEGLANIFIQNTAGSDNRNLLGNGGAIALAAGAEADILGNYFLDHNASNNYGGAVFLTGNETHALIGDRNDTDIIDAPLTELQLGNIFQNNNRRFNALPVLRSSPGEIPDDPVDSLYCEEPPPPVYPEPDTTLIPIPVDDGPPTSTTVEPNYSPQLYVYTTNQSAGVQIIDVTNPFGPFVFGELATEGSATAAAVRPGYLYVGDSELGLLVYQTSPLAMGLKPSLLTTLELGGAGLIDVKVLGDFIYAISKDNQIQVVKQTGTSFEWVGTMQPEDPETMTFTGLETQVDLVGLRVNVSDTTGEYRLLAPDGNSLELLSTYPVPGILTDIAGQGSQVYLLYAYKEEEGYAGSLVTLDIADPLAPSPLPWPALTSDRLLTAADADTENLLVTTNDGFYRLGILDGTSEFSLTEKPGLDVAVSGPLGYIAQGYDGLGIYEAFSQDEFGTAPAPERTRTVTIEFPAMIGWIDEVGPDTNWMYLPPEVPDTLTCEGEPGNAAGMFRFTELLSLDSYDRSRYVYDVNDTLITRYGGAIAVVDAAEAGILGNLIGGQRFWDGNTATEQGGGIFTGRSGTVQIGLTPSGAPAENRKNYLLGNISRDGGGISVTGNTETTVSIVNNQIGGQSDNEANLAHHSGGGILVDTAAVLIEQNIIRRNVCGIDSIPNTAREGFGAGIALLGSQAGVVNNWITGNFACGNGAGIGLGREAGKTRLEGNTWSENYALRSRVEAVKDSAGLANSLYIGRIADSCIIRNNIFDHFGTYESFAVYVDSSRNAEGEYAIDSTLIVIENNDIRNNTGYRVGGLLADPTGQNGNLSVNPLFVDPAAGNYNLDFASPATGMGWNPEPGISLISDLVYRVPDNYSTISAAMAAARYGDRIVVDTTYDYEQETFPIQIKDGVILTSTAFDPILDLNIIEQTILDDDGSNVLQMTGTGPRTVVSGFTIRNGNTGFLVEDAAGLVNANLLYGNNTGMALVFHETCTDTTDRFPDRLYVDHNTVESEVAIHYDTMSCPEWTYDVFPMVKMQFGPVLSYNISKVSANIEGGPSLAEYLTIPPLAITFEQNDFWPEDLSGYYDDRQGIAEDNLRTADPVFFSGEDFHLDEGSPCFILRTFITEDEDTLTVKDTNYSGLIGALYAMTEVIFSSENETALTGVPVTFTDSSRSALPYDRKLKTWYFGTGDSLELIAPAYPYSVQYAFPTPGSFDVGLQIRDRYATFGSTVPGLIDVVSGLEEIIPAGPFTSVKLYPNPFNSGVQIDYELSEAAGVQIAICDLTGRPVRMIKNGFHLPGRYQQQWQGQSDQGSVLPAGMYLVRLSASAGGEDFVHQRILVKGR